MKITICNLIGKYGKLKMYRKGDKDVISKNKTNIYPR